MTRERERGTMENLLATPVRPIEVMTGKIVPYIIVGYIQITIILLAAWLLFGVPMVGSLVLLSAAAILFIAANLSVGFTFSTLARNQLQAMQMAFFFFLPSILLGSCSFRGMPEWAQWLGERAAHAFPARPARHTAQGQRGGRDRTGIVADRPVSLDGGGHRADALPRDARLRNLCAHLRIGSLRWKLLDRKKQA
jgi:ABC-type multidrug transport system permease subunit